MSSESLKEITLLKQRIFAMETKEIGLVTQLKNCNSKIVNQRNEIHMLKRNSEKQGIVLERYVKSIKDYTEGFNRINNQLIDIRKHRDELLKEKENAYGNLFRMVPIRTRKNFNDIARNYFYDNITFENNVRKREKEYIDSFNNHCKTPISKRKFYNVIFQGRSTGKTVMSEFAIAEFKSKYPDKKVIVFNDEFSEDFYRTFYSYRGQFFSNLNTQY